jgi:hypothetical protein
VLRVAAFRLPELLACLPIELFDHLGRVTCYNAATIGERPGDNGIGAYNGVIAQLDPREDHRSHADPATSAYPDGRTGNVLRVVDQVMVSGNDAYIRPDIGEISYFDSVDRMNEIAGRIAGIDIAPPFDPVGEDDGGAMMNGPWRPRILTENMFEKEVGEIKTYPHVRAQVKGLPDQF